jgi:hypothetical protein
VINLATIGAGGMDTGVAAVNGYVALYVIYNPVTGTSALLGANAAAVVAPEIYGGVNMPAGYTCSALVSVWPTNASGQFKVGCQTGRELSFPAILGINTTTSANMASLSLAGSVPLNAKTVSGGLLGLITIGSGNVITSICSDVNTTGLQEIAGYSQASGVSVKGAFRGVLLITPQTVYFSANGITGGGYNWQIYVNGYTF